MVKRMKEKQEEMLNIQKRGEEEKEGGNRKVSGNSV